MNKTIGKVCNMLYRNDITTLAFYGHSSEAIKFFSMWQWKLESEV